MANYESFPLKLENVFLEVTFYEIIVIKFEYSRWRIQDGSEHRNLGSDLLQI